MNQPVCPSVWLSCKLNSSLLDELILMKLYIVTVYYLRMCIKEDNPRPNISREIISNAGRAILLRVVFLG